MPIEIERLTRKDWLWPLLFLLLGVAGAAAAHHFFFQAFPEASIDLRLPKEEIAGRSLNFLRGRGLPVDGYRRFTTFDFDDQAKTYLERELGLEDANRLMSTSVHIWRWKTRLIKPPQKEEITVWLTPAGELAGFDHKVEEKLAGAKLAMAQAQRIAEVFLRAELRMDLDRYKLVTDDLKTRDNRLDYTFTWEKKDLQFKDATARFSVTVIGDQVGGFMEFLKIPDQWTRDFRRLRSRNDLLAQIAVVIYVLLLAAAVFVIAKSARLKMVRWKAPLAIGGVVGFLIVVEVLNSFPLAAESFPTNIPYETLRAFWFLVAVLAGIVSGLYTMLLAASGEPLYRELSPNRVALNHLFTSLGLRTKEFFTSTLIGYGMAGMHIGLVVLFYMVARRFGAWAPLDVNYNNAISTALPWISPLADSAFAATTEEFGFRLFAIPLLLRWTKNKWLAVIVPAFLWGFLHSNYPQQPAWIRGVEVGMIGIVAGWVFLRFGILATLVWHYTVDAVLIGLFLLRSEQITFRIAGALVGDAVLLPLLISVVFYVESRGFLRDVRILNGAPEGSDVETGTIAAVKTPLPPLGGPPEPSPAAVSAGSAEFLFLPPVRMRFLVAAALLALVVLARVNAPTIGSEISIEAGPAKAESAAVQYLMQRGVPVATYRRVTRLEERISGPAADYLWDRAGAASVGAIYRDRVPSVFWHTRFFRPLEKEEYEVVVAPDGRVARYVHTLDEKAPGARLEKPEALARASAFLRQKGVNLGDYRLVDHDLEKRDARNDHTLTWERNAKLAGEAAQRMGVGIKGDEITGPLYTVKIPEEWERRHTQFTAFTLLPFILFVGLGLAGMVLTVRAIPRVSPRWRLHLGLGAAGAAVQLIRVVNNIPSWGFNYRTSVTWANSATQSALNGLMLAVFIFVGLAALGAVADTLLSERFGGFCHLPPRGPDRARALLEGLIAGASAALIWSAARTLGAVVLERIPSAVRGVSSGLPGYPVSFSPGLSLFTEALNAALWSTLLIAAVAAVLLRMFRNKAALAAALLAGTAILAGAGALDGAHFAKLWISVLAPAGVMLALILVLRFNLASYLVMGLVGVGLTRLLSLWRHSGLHDFAVQLAVGLTLLLLWMLWRVSRELAH